MSAWASAAMRNGFRWVRRLSLGLTRGERLAYFLIQLVLILGGSMLALTKRTVLVGVGTGLIATGAAGLITFARAVMHEDQAARLVLYARFGILGAFERRGAMIRDEYDKRLREARRFIDVIGFGLHHLQEDYRQDFPQWAAASTVRILLLDPEAPDGGLSYADARDAEEGEAEGTIAGEVRDFLDRTAELRRDHGERFQVRLYRAMPSINMFRVDDTMFFGPYLMERPSRNTPTLLLGRGVLFDELASHFDALWSDRFSRPAP